jgi:transcriptional regulator with XRE-family HTH domain
MGRIFGEYIKDLRVDRKLTLREVEEKAHISNAYLSQVERGERGTPTMKILVKLAEVYGVPASVLSDKAEAELRYEMKEGKKGAKEEVPAPDTEFICRGYENLSAENKQTLKKFLQHLQTDNKGKK